MSSGDDVVIIGQVINHQQTNADADDIGRINGQQRNDAAEKKKTEKNLNELTGREKQLLEEFGLICPQRETGPVPHLDHRIDGRQFQSSFH